MIAKIISGVLATILSYVLNREWAFKNRGGHQVHHEALLFFGITGIGVGLQAALAVVREQRVQPPRKPGNSGAGCRRLRSSVSSSATCCRWASGSGLRKFASRRPTWPFSAEHQPAGDNTCTGDEVNGDELNGDELNGEELGHA